MQSDQKKLHLGCGDVRFSGWLNIDIDTPTADMNLDFTKPLPFFDNSITHIFSEHFIEHVSRDDAVRFLMECQRILAPDGAVRITTPNLRFLIASYLAENKGEWGELWQPETPCFMMNEGMRSWGHQFLYDVDELVRVFVQAGFNSISFQEYRKSSDEEFCGRESRPFHNELIIEARKIEGDIQSIDTRAIKNIEAQWPIKLANEQAMRFAAAEQTIADQANHICAIEAERAERGQHIEGLEQTIANQTNHIANQTDHIADQTNHIHAIEAELVSRGQRIVDLEQTVIDKATYISTIEASLEKFQGSIYGRFISGVSHLYSFIKIRRV